MTPWMQHMWNSVSRVHWGRGHTYRLSCGCMASFTSCRTCRWPGAQQYMQYMQYMWHMKRLKIKSAGAH